MVSSSTPLRWGKSPRLTETLLKCPLLLHARILQQCQPNQQGLKFVFAWKNREMVLSRAAMKVKIYIFPAISQPRLTLLQGVVCTLPAFCGQMRRTCLREATAKELPKGPPGSRGPKSAPFVGEGLLEPPPPTHTHTEKIPPCGLMSAVSSGISSL